MTDAKDSVDPDVSNNDADNVNPKDNFYDDSDNIDTDMLVC